MSELEIFESGVISALKLIFCAMFPTINPPGFVTLEIFSSPVLIFKSLITSFGVL